MCTWLKCNKPILSKFDNASKVVLGKGPSFFTTPTDINWYEH